MKKRSNRRNESTPYMYIKKKISLYGDIFLVFYILILKIFFITLFFNIRFNKYLVS